MHQQVAVLALGKRETVEHEEAKGNLTYLCGPIVKVTIYAKFTGGQPHTETRSWSGPTKVLGAAALRY
jgi:hypothetical protein